MIIAGSEYTPLTALNNSFDILVFKAIPDLKWFSFNVTLGVSSTGLNLKAPSNILDTHHSCKHIL